MSDNGGVMLRWRGRSRRGPVAGGTTTESAAVLAESLYRRGYHDVTILHDEEEVGGIGWADEGPRRRIWWGAS